MTFLGGPIFDWILLVVLLGFGVEAWITCRDTGESSKSEPPEPKRSAQDGRPAPGDPPGKV